MAIRVENLSSADQELAPGSGFVPAHGFRDFPDAEFKEQHEKYAKARLESDPPILKVSAAPADAEAPKEAEKSPAQEQTEQNAEDARKAEEQARQQASEQRRDAESSRRHR